MLCPSCKKENAKCLDSRPIRSGLSRRRRYYCEQCDKRFTSYELSSEDIANIANGKLDIYKVALWFKEE